MENAVWAWSYAQTALRFHPVIRGAGQDPSVVPYPKVCRCCRLVALAGFTAFRIRATSRSQAIRVRPSDTQHLDFKQALEEFAEWLREVRHGRRQVAVQSSRFPADRPLCVTRQLLHG